MEVFEEQAIESTTQKPKIWKRYVDETITILDRSYVDCLLQHLNSQQPTIRFTMERLVSYEGTIQTPDQQCLQKTNSHKSVLSAWFTPPSMSKTRYC